MDKSDERNSAVRIKDIFKNYYGNINRVRREKIYAGFFYSGVVNLFMERAPGIEPGHKPWQGFKLPLHHARIWYLSLAGRPGFEPRYSVPKTDVLPLHHPPIFLYTIF